MDLLSCGANRDNYDDPWLVLAASLIEHDAGPLTIGTTGVRVHQRDHRSPQRGPHTEAEDDKPGPRRVVRGERDRRVDDPRAVVLAGDSRYRKRDRALLAIAVEPLGLVVANRPSGHARGRPASNRLTDDQRRAIAAAMAAAVDQCRRNRILGATQQAANEVVADFDYVCTTRTAIGIWRADGRPT